MILCWHKQKEERQEVEFGGIIPTPWVNGTEEEVEISGRIGGIKRAKLRNTAVTSLVSRPVDPENERKN